MGCIINFLSVEYQNRIVNMIQNKDETFETCLEDYCKIILFHKQQLLEDVPKEGINGKPIQPCSNSDCMFKDSCYQICGVLKQIPEEKIRDFFERIKTCFLKWIDSDYSASLNIFDGFLQEFELARGPGAESDALCLEDLESRVFYRGRLSNQQLSRIDLYHVPFNKRYLIKSGRFSLAGQPLLYLCNSVIGVIEELDVDRDDPLQLKRLKVSSYEFKASKRIYDLRCNIWHDLKNVKTSTFSEAKFWRNLLSIVCCFPKRQGVDERVFIEEYVIPQMLAQALKRLQYDGLCHYSTKPFSGFFYNSNDKIARNTEGIRINDMRTMAYRENLVVFPKRRHEGTGTARIEPVDNSLFDDLDISVPTGLFNIRDTSEETLTKLHSDLNGKNKTRFREQQKAKLVYDFYQETFHILMDREKRYCDTAYGKIQIQLLVGILNRLLIEGEQNRMVIADENATRENSE